MVNEGLVEKLGSKRGTQYRIVNRMSQRMRTTNHPFGPESKKAIAQTRLPLYLLHGLAQISYSSQKT